MKASRSKINEIKHCKYCGKELQRKIYRDKGRLKRGYRSIFHLELPSMFKRRIFCDRRCLARYLHQNKLLGFEKINTYEAKRLYDLKMNDAEIAKELGVVKGTIYYWRKKLGLPPNAKRGAQRNEKNPVFNAIKNQNWRDPMKNPKTAEKVAQGRLGANNPNWKGGKSNRSIYGRQRLKRLGLLNFCWLCGKKGELHVHHINKNPKDNELSNLIVLCPKCHMKIHKGRIKLEWKSRLESLVPAIELKFPPTSGFKPFQRYFSKESVAHPAN